MKTMEEYLNDEKTAVRADGPCFFGGDYVEMRYFNESGPCTLEEATLVNISEMNSKTGGVVYSTTRKLLKL